MSEIRMAGKMYEEGAFGCGAFQNDAHVVSYLIYRAMKDFQNFNDFYRKD